MGLEAITVGAADHFAKGGVKSLSVGSFDGTASFSSTGAHGVSVSASAADEVVLEFEKETAKMTTSTTQEKGLALTTVSIEGYIPNISDTLYSAIQELKGLALYGKVELWSGVTFLVGWDNVLKNSATDTDFALFFDSAESDSGAGLSDQNGLTLKLTAVQGEEPRLI
jgi:hypothetical protein